MVSTFLMPRRVQDDDSMEKEDWSYYPELRHRSNDLSSISGFLDPSSFSDSSNSFIDSSHLPVIS